MKFAIACVVIVAELALSGCSATGPVFKEAAPAPSGKALVYIYRPSSFAFSARDAHFYVNGEELVHLSNGGYTQAYLPAGRHQIMERWNDSTAAAIVFGGTTKTVEVPLEAKAGEVYYFRFSTGVGDPAYQAINLVWQLQQVPAKLGAAEILETKYQPGKL